MLEENEKIGLPELAAYECTGALWYVGAFLLDLSALRWFHLDKNRCC